MSSPTACPMSAIASIALPRRRSASSEGVAAAAAGDPVGAAAALMISLARGTKVP